MPSDGRASRDICNFVDGQRATPPKPAVLWFAMRRNSTISAEKKLMTADFRQKQQKQRTRPFQKGRSDNPVRRPRGCRNRSTQTAQLVLEGEAAALTRKAVEFALGGNPAALRLCLDRLIAPHREWLVASPLPPMRQPADLAGAMEAVVRGLLAPGEAVEMAKVVETFVRAIETRDYDSRLRGLGTSVPGALTLFPGP
jgi:Family of unknown function (DUF5681)